MTENSESSLRNLDIDYERSDVPLRAYAIAAIGLILLLAVAPLVVRLAYPQTGGDVNRQLTITPPEPRLRTSPPDDLAAYLAEQRALLGSYDWVDRGKGIAREPIDEAMKRLVREGADGFPKQAAGQ